MSACGCVYVGDYDPADVCVDHMRKARRRHECCECRRVIAPKEWYEDSFLVWDGRPARYKTCEDCLSLRKAFFCDGYLYQFLWENWRDALFDAGGAVDWLAMEKLTPRAKARAMEIIQEMWDATGAIDDD